MGKEKHEDKWQITVGFRINKVYDHVVRKIARKERRKPSDVWRKIVADHDYFKGLKVKDE